jgi:hypothetical protein
MAPTEIIIWKVVCAEGFKQECQRVSSKNVRVSSKNVRVSSKNARVSSKNAREFQARIPDMPESFKLESHTCQRV